MAQRTIARMYDDYDDAKAIVHELEAFGVPHSEISLVANADAHGRSISPTGASAVARDDRPLDPVDHVSTTPGSAGATGAVVGTLLGGGAGLLAGIGALAIPGVGPVVAAGWLVATLTGAGIGAASGGLVGSLTGAGFSRDEAHVYAEGVKRGGSLVTVRVDESQASRVETIMSERRSTDWEQRRGTYGDDWKGFDETSSGMTHGNVAAASPTRAPLPDRDATYAPGVKPTQPL